MGSGERTNPKPKTIGPGDGEFSSESKCFRPLPLITALDYRYRFRFLSSIFSPASAEYTFPTPAPPVRRGFRTGLTK